MLSSGNSFTRAESDDPRPPQMGLLARVTGGQAAAMSAFDR
jgi:hypothetical protein